MIRRQIVMPVSPERLWEALTEPGQLAKWFGADVEWDLREGGPARFRRDDGTERAGRVEAVRPGRHLRFRWWPAEPAASRPPAARGPKQDPPGEPEEDVESEISYLLEPIDEGTRTRLTVQERQIAENRQVGGSPRAQAPGGWRPSADPPTGQPDTGWSAWDARLFGAWAGCSTTVSTVRPGARA
jgi:uncharacterized protein YndB with AHSA1/START domain